MVNLTADKPQKLSKLCLKEVSGLSYGVFMKLLRKKDVKVNGVRVDKDLSIEKGDKVTLYYTIQPNISYTPVYSDENVLVIDKASGFTSEAVYEAILNDYPTAKFIHRLDRNTSGVMIFALNETAESELLYGFKNRTFDKKYLCTVYGVLERDSEILTAYLVKDRDNSTVKIFDKKVNGSVEIKTGYKVISRGENTSDLLVTLYTGKTHQIRAHLAHIGHFIIGDGKYGDEKLNRQYGATRQKLKAHILTLNFKKEDKLYYLNDKTFKV
ncbi:MAG: RluA family pseudouridine synthase [Clostridiales bacterium]|nr:RluA family pseudouridine synthase [Clostridiales bacterium]